MMYLPLTKISARWRIFQFFVIGCIWVFKRPLADFFLAIIIYQFGFYIPFRVFFICQNPLRNSRDRDTSKHGIPQSLLRGFKSVLGHDIALLQ